MMRPCTDPEGLCRGFLFIRRVPQTGVCPQKGQRGTGGKNEGYSKRRNDCGDKL